MTVRFVLFESPLTCDTAGDMNVSTWRSNGGMMASCRYCGIKAGVGREVCISCERKQRASKARKRDEERKDWKREQVEQRRRKAEEEADKLEEAIRMFVDAHFDQMEKAHSHGLTPSLIQCLFLTTSYSLMGQPAGQAPHISTLQKHLSLGWEISAVIPHTEGVALTNRAGTGATSYGGGIGGIVTAAYFILRLPIHPSILKNNRQYVEDILRSQYEDGGSIAAPGYTPTVESAAQTGGMSEVRHMAVRAAAGTAVGTSLSNLMGMGDDGVADAGFDGGDGGGDFEGFDF